MKELTAMDRKELFERRILEFPEEIRRLAHQDPVIHQLIDLYAMGRILTREEALCQMVVRQSEVASTRLKSLLDIRGMNPIPSP